MDSHFLPDMTVHTLLVCRLTCSRRLLDSRVFADVYIRFTAH
jgi:hypothetical protein